MLGRRYSDFDVLMQWIHILRAIHWPGPTFTHRDTYPSEGRNVITAGALLRDDWDDYLSIDSDHLPAPTFIQRIAEYPLDGADLSSVARAGDQVDLRVNPNLITTTPVGPANPPFAIHDTNYWAQGVNFGLEFRY